MKLAVVLLAAIALLAGCADPEEGPVPDDDASSPAASQPAVDADDPDAPLMDRIEAAIERALRAA